MNVTAVNSAFAKLKGDARVARKVTREMFSDFLGQSASWNLADGSGITPAEVEHITHKNKEFLRWANDHNIGIKAFFPVRFSARNDRPLSSLAVLQQTETFVIAGAIGLAALATPPAAIAVGACAVLASVLLTVNLAAPDLTNAAVYSLDNFLDSMQIAVVRSSRRFDSYRWGSPTS